MDQSVDVLSEYIRYCAETIIPVKEQRVYANDKPWVRSSLKKLLREKREVFGSGDRSQLKEVQTRIDREIKSCKLAYKRKLERNFSQNNTQAAWRAMESITGYKGKKKPVDFSADFVDELNRFYGRFEVHDFRKENSELKGHLEYLISQINGGNNRICVTEENVRKVLGKVKVNKATGPDGICNRLLKCCNQQLAPLLCRIFQMCLDTGVIPKLWKTSTIIPIPKKNKAQEPNDFRPVALTSNIMKCFERLFLVELLKESQGLIDPYQFAYRPNRSVEDATLVFLHKIYEHLDRAKSYTRSLFAWRLGKNLG